jgi:hypothetical protein
MPDLSKACRIHDGFRALLQSQWDSRGHIDIYRSASTDVETHASSFWAQIYPPNTLDIKILW